MQTSLGKLLLWLLCSMQLLYSYTITMHVDNTHPLLAELITLRIDFYYDNIEEYEIQEPHFEHFIVTLLEEKESQESNGTWHAQQHYKLIPQKVGTFILSPLKAHYEMIPPAYQKRYNKNRYLQKKDIFTKPLTLEVKTLPQGLHVAGNYTLTSSIDAQQTSAGMPIHFTLTLSGVGNLENLDFFSLQIPHTTIYEKSLSAHKKTFDIVAKQDYVIPAVSLKYFNQKTKSVMLTSTPTYPIKILQKTSVTQHIYPLVAFLFGILALILYALWVLLKLAYLDEKKYFIKQLKRCKNKEALLKKVAPYIQENRQLSRLIYQLEESDAKRFKGLKKEILKHFYY